MLINICEDPVQYHICRKHYTNGPVNEAKYSHLNSAHTFTPVAIETSGVFGAKTMRFVQELGQRLERVTGEVRSTNFLIQRLSVAVQRGNSASVLGTMDLQRV